MIIERILEIIRYKGISKSQFYRDVGLSNGFLDKVKDVGSSKIEKILKVYPEINPVWLVTGEGNMLKDDKSVTKFDDKDDRIDDLKYLIELQKEKINRLEKELKEVKSAKRNVAEAGE